MQSELQDEVYRVQGELHGEVYRLQSELLDEVYRVQSKFQGRYKAQGKLRCAG